VDEAMLTLGRCTIAPAADHTGMLDSLTALTSCMKRAACAGSDTSCASAAIVKICGWNEVAIEITCDDVDEQRAQSVG
jgi:hypothetical protein